MTISASATQLTLTDESLIASMIVNGESLDFTAYNGALSSINPTLVMSINDTAFLSPFLAYAWSSGETTQAITVTPTETGDLTRSVTTNDGVESSNVASATVSIISSIESISPPVSAVIYFN